MTKDHILLHQANQNLIILDIFPLIINSTTMFFISVRKRYSKISHNTLHVLFLIFLWNKNSSGFPSFGHILPLSFHMPLILFLQSFGFFTATCPTDWALHPYTFPVPSLQSIFNFWSAFICQVNDATNQISTDKSQF